MPAPLVPDIQAPFDPTAFATISGAALLQFLTGAFPQIDTGFIKVTADGVGNTPTVPNALITTKWQKYIWIRVSSNAVTGYLWNPNAGIDPTLLQWVPFNQASIGPGTIVGNMIQDNTIPASKIISLDYSQLTGVPGGTVPSGPAGGSLTGNYPNPTIAALAINNGMIAQDGVNGIIAANLNSKSVSVTKMLGDGSAKDMMRSGTGGDATIMEWFTPPTVFTSGVVVTTANQGKVPQVLTAGAGDTGTWAMVAPTTLGRILQIIETEDATTQNTANNIATNALPTTASGAHYTQLDTAITPLSASSTLLIEMGVFMANSSDATNAYVLALMQDAIVNSLAASCFIGQAANHYPVLVLLRFKVASGSTAARTYKAYYGGTAGTTYLNGNNLGALFGGGFPLSWMRVTEYL